ncbi:MAG: SCO family protein [Gammaproteobacteria bacterium]
MNQTSQPSVTREAFWILPGVLLAALIWFFFFKPTVVTPPELMQATLLPVARSIQPFSLEQIDSPPFTLDNLKGEWSFVFFGYTHCPDICPTTLQDLARVMKQLDEKPGKREKPQVIFISVDPERDQGQQLTDYVRYFNDQFIGITGSPDELLTLTRQLGVIYAKVSGDAKENYLVDHSAVVILFDPNGDFRAVFSAPHKADAIVHDLGKIQQFFTASRL